MKTGEVLVIDLFAGPGGLGEGISSVKDTNGNEPFKIGVSIEKDPFAHKTLTTRALYRQLKDSQEGLKRYNEYLQGVLTRKQLFELFPKEANAAQQETLYAPHALGKDNEDIHKRISDLVNHHGCGPKIVIGGPPCQAYSLAGRSRNAGIKGYVAENDHRNFLYKEYLRVLSVAKPDVFVMENVQGILSAKINGEIIFPRILRDLKSPGRITKISTPRYKIFSLVIDAKEPSEPTFDSPSDFLIKSENYGIPQARHRVILLGVRADLAYAPTTLRQHPKQYTVEQVISDLPKLRSGLSKQNDNALEWEKIVFDNAKIIKTLLRSKFKETDFLNINPLLQLKRSSINTFKGVGKIPKHLVRWYKNNEPPCVLNHETRSHMKSDLLRYAYSASFTQLTNGSSPRAKDFPQILSPEHENWMSGAYSDRFRTQAANKCSTTITSHISKDGNYFIHYDPQQCRSLTVREAARLQTFPDNYFFEGNRTQQYIQVGNAVPPYLAQQIGKIVLELLKRNNAWT